MVSGARSVAGACSGVCACAAPTVIAIDASSETIGRSLSVTGIAPSRRRSGTLHIAREEATKLAASLPGFDMDQLNLFAIHFGWIELTIRIDKRQACVTVGSNN